VTDNRAGPPGPRAQVFHQSAGAVVLAEGRCLVLHLAGSDEWVFPKGHLEEGDPDRSEDPNIVAGLLRDLADRRVLGSSGPAKGHRKHVEWFLAEPIGGVLALEPIFSELEFLDPAAAQRLLSHVSDRQIAEGAFELACELDQ
jgi:hypothetical protein